MQYANMAQQVQSRGRGDDTMLVHMTPREVGGLQALAMASGGSLSVNPDTGLPEAGWLGDLLPTILGVVGAAFGIPTWAIGLGTAAGGTALTGDLGKGLMAGLSAFGGASLAGAAGIGGAISNNALGLAGGAGKAAGAAGAAVPAAATNPFATQSATQLAGMAKAAPSMANMAGAGIGALPSQAAQMATLPGVGAGAAAGAGVPAAKGGIGGFLQRFGDSAKAGLPPGTPGIIQKAAPMAAGLGVLNSVSNAMTPGMPKMEEDKNQFPYTGPYSMQPRKAVYPTPGGTDQQAPANPAQTRDSSEFNYFPEPVQFLDGQGKPYTPGMMGPGVPSKDDKKKKSSRLFSAGGMVPATPMQVMPQGPNTNMLVNQMPTVTQAAGLPAIQNSSYPAAPAPGQPAGDAGIKGLPALAAGGEVPSAQPLSGKLAQMTVPSFASPLSAPAGGANPLTAALGAYRQGRTGAAPAPFANRPQGGEQDFFSAQRAKQAKVTQPTNPLGGFGQYVDIPGVGSFQLPDLSGIDFSQFGAQAPVQTPATSTSPAMTSIPNAGHPYQFESPFAPPPVPEAPPVSPPIQFDPSTVDWSQLNFNGYGFASGGAVSLSDGSFVVDARTVSELGNGSSGAGQDILAKLGGTPVRGGGDGVSDSIPAHIDGKQAARVARDEVVFDPQTVAQIGGGNHQRGTAKLYALMDRAHKARKKAKAGEDTGLARGLGAL